MGIVLYAIDPTIFIKRTGKSLTFVKKPEKGFGHEIHENPASSMEALADLPEAGNQTLSLAEKLCPGVDGQTGISAREKDRKNNGGDASASDLF